MNDQNLGGLPLVQQEETPEEQSKQDKSQQFDFTGKARQESIRAVEEILLRAAKGAKLNRKNELSLFRNFLKHMKATDKMISALVHDLHRVVQAVAQNEVNVFSLRTNVKTVVKSLERKGMIQIDELRKIHDEEILPEELPPGTSEALVNRLKQASLDAADEMERKD